MSFTNDIKKEILTYEYSDAELKAELYGILKIKSELVLSFKGINLEIKTASLNIARRIVFLVKKIYGLSIELKSKERANLDHQNIYYLTITENVKEILVDLELMSEDYNLISEVSKKYDEYKVSVIRGFFLAKGSINDPSKSYYHLEISCNLDEEVDYICEAVRESYIIGKKIQRRNNCVFYLKKAEQIGDFLKFLNATSTLFYFENERIKRDLSNVVNRVMNCDIANSQRSQETASKQIEYIKLIEKYKGLNNLSTRLLEAVKLRVENPDATLSELSDMSEEVVGRQISKSGISHCMKDLENIAKTLTNNK